MTAPKTDAQKKKHAAYMVQWRLNNSEAAKAIDAKRRAKDVKKRSARDRAYYRNNSDKIKARSSAWAVENKERRKVHRASRKASKLNNGGVLSKDICQKLFLLQRGMCACCSELLGNDYHLDHIVPLAKGGENSDHNVQLLRAICNLEKRAKCPIKFMQEFRGRLL